MHLFQKGSPSCGALLTLWLLLKKTRAGSVSALNSFTGLGNGMPPKRDEGRLQIMNEDGGKDEPGHLH